MNFLAIETSTEACSVALQAGGTILDRHIVEARSHTRVLLPCITELLREADIGVADLDTIVLGNGPGSFIGMRIGASVAQGLAYGAGIDITPVSSLAAAAQVALDVEQSDRVAVAQDARMGEVYLGLYERDADGLADPVAPEVLQSAASIVWPQVSTTWLCVGAGWARYPELLKKTDSATRGPESADLPNAKALLALGIRDFRRGAAIAPDSLEPAYLRQQVAKPPVS